MALDRHQLDMLHDCVDKIAGLSLRSVCMIAMVSNLYLPDFLLYVIDTAL